MRFLALAGLAAFSFGLINAGPAHATWSCIGPEVACNSKGVKKAYQPRSSKAERTRRANRTAQRRSANERRKTASRGTATRSVASYGGGSHGIASYYWQPQRVASGGYFNPNALTAAHRTLPFGTKVRVTNKRNGRSVVVTINDRGPFIKGRIIDLSKRAAGVIGMQGAGLAPVHVQVIG